MANRDNTVYGAGVLDHEEQTEMKLQSKVKIYHENVIEWMTIFQFN